jgi:hypothetical protein
MLAAVVVAFGQLLLQPEQAVLAVAGMAVVTAFLQLPARLIPAAAVVVTGKAVLQQGWAAAPVSLSSNTKPLQLRPLPLNPRRSG